MSVGQGHQHTWMIARSCRRPHRQAPSWNAGVWLADFSQWDKLHVSEDALFWIHRETQREKAGESRLWKLNTQPIMYLVFHNVVRKSSQFLPHGWNCESLDSTFDDVPPPECQIMCVVLHIGTILGLRPPPHCLQPLEWWREALESPDKWTPFVAAVSAAHECLGVR